MGSASVASSSCLIAMIEKNSRETLHVSLNEYRGNKLVNLRIWYEDREGHIRPGNSGVALRVDKLDDLIAALIKARVEAAAVGWLAPAIRPVPTLVEREVGP